MSEYIYNKAYKFRLLPNFEQITLFAKIAVKISQMALKHPQYAQLISWIS